MIYFFIFAFFFFSFPFCLFVAACCCSWRGLYLFIYLFILYFFASLFGFHFLFVLLLCYAIIMVCFPIVRCGVVVVSMYGLLHTPLSPPSFSSSQFPCTHPRTHARTHTRAHTQTHAHVHLSYKQLHGRTTISISICTQSNRRIVHKSHITYT